MFKASLPNVPYQVRADTFLDIYEAKFDALIHSRRVYRAIGRAECIAGTGEFHAVIFGAITNSGSLSPSGFSTLILGCPDWSILGWNQNFFASYYSEQQLSLSRASRNQALNDMVQGAYTNWIDTRGRIIVNTSPSTIYSVPSQIGSRSYVELSNEFTSGTTVMINAVFHCNAQFDSKKKKVFTVEATEIQKIVPADMTRSPRVDTFAPKSESALIFVLRTSPRMKDNSTRGHLCQLCIAPLLAFRGERTISAVGFIGEAYINNQFKAAGASTQSWSK
ncbi:hypothetical protein DFH07DRAFT_769809 [Mycena maculata]|uniref:Uncharacterized protein n=1 Tax=Mycena maculata TaxID=230809 RepID=A0AAD7NML1_9AGAR|nr:hypothetical protein DFH07DRAFT_769809 [Mycena maculata]